MTLILGVSAMRLGLLVYSSTEGGSHDDWKTAAGTYAWLALIFGGVVAVVRWFLVDAPL